MLGLNGVALALLLAPSSSTTSRPELSLRWTAPRSCPDGASVEASVARRLASRPTTDRKLVADARVTETESGYMVVLEIAEAGERTTRSFEALDCTEASETAALLLAITIDPLAEPEPEPEPEPVEPEPVEPEPVEPKPIPEAPQTAPAEPTPPREAVPIEPEPPTAAEDPSQLLRPAVHGLGLRAHVLGGVGFGPLPTATGVIGGGIGVGGGLWQVEATGEFWTPSVGGQSVNPEIEVRARLFAFGARGCFVLHPRTLTIPLCAGVAAGVMTADGENVRVPDTARSPWVGVRAGPGLVWWPSRWLGLSGRVDGVLSMYQPRFTTSPSGLVHEARLGGVTALIGVNLRFLSTP